MTAATAIRSVLFRDQWSRLSLCTGRASCCPEAGSARKVNKAPRGSPDTRGATPIPGPIYNPCARTEARPICRVEQKKYGSGLALDRA